MYFVLLRTTKSAGSLLVGASFAGEEAGVVAGSEAALGAEAGASAGVVTGLAAGFAGFTGVGRTICFGSDAALFVSSVASTSISVP